MHSEIKKFIYLLTGGKNKVHLQSFSEGNSQGYPELKYGHITELEEWIAAKINAGQSVFCAVNETDGIGRKVKNIVKVRALFADFDDVSNDNLLKIKQLSPKPHIVVNTSPGKYHAYWLVFDCDLEQFKPLQQAIIRKLGTDPSVCDLSRVMRIPGTYNRKKEPFLVKLIDLYGNVPAPPPYTVKMIVHGLGLQLQKELVVNNYESSSKGIALLKSDEAVLMEIEKARFCLRQGKASVFDLFSANTDVLSICYPDKIGKNPYNASSADLALCCHLARITNSDIEQIDRIFRQSKLYREKWDREDYRNSTIKKAINSVNNLDNVPGEMGNVKETVEHVPLKIFKIQKGIAGNGNHVENAIFLLSNVFKGRLKKHESSFLWWTGRYYEKVSRSTVRFQVGLAISGVGKASQSNIKSQTETLFDHAEEIIDIDPPSIKIFFKNGVFDLSKKAFQPHHHSNHNTRTLNVNYNPLALAPEFSRWISEIFSIYPEQIELLEEILGSFLFRSNLGIEKAFLFIGPPRAGKGTLAWLIKSILGNAAAAFNLCDLHDGKQINTLRHAQVGIDAEATGPAYRYIREVVTRFKAITANDFFSSPIIYQAQTWNGPTNCKLVAMANSVPYLPDDSGAAINRWIALVFNKSFQGNEDITLKGRLLNELEGIAMIALRGALRLMERGKFNMPSIGADMLASVATASGGIQHFIKEQCIVGGNERCSEKDLFDAYIRWCVSEGQKPLQRQTFLKALEDATRGDGVLRKPSLRLSGRDTPTRGFVGIGLKPNSNGMDANVIPNQVPKPNPFIPPPPPPIKH